MPAVRISHLSGIGPEFLGRVRLGSSIASLAGVWIFQNFLKEIKISRILFWTTVAAVPLGFTQVAVSCFLEIAYLRFLAWCLCGLTDALLF